LYVLLALCTDHVTACFVEGMDLLGCEIVGDLTHGSDNLIDKGLALAGLQCYKVPSAFIRNLDESVTSHILDAFVTVSVTNLRSGARRHLPS